jgi:hypothetical protein
MPAMSGSKGSSLERHCEILSDKFLIIITVGGGGGQGFFKRLESNSSRTKRRF